MQDSSPMQLSNSPPPLPPSPLPALPPLLPPPPQLPLLPALPHPHKETKPHSPKWSSFQWSAVWDVYELCELGTYILGLRDTPKPWQLKAPGRRPTIKQLNLIVENAFNYSGSSTLIVRSRTELLRNGQPKYRTLARVTVWGFLLGHGVRRGCLGYGGGWVLGGAGGGLDCMHTVKFVSITSESRP